MHTPRATTIRLAACGSALLLTAAWLAPAAEDAPRARTAKAATEEPAGKYMGVADCARCHRSPTPEDEALGITDRVALTEYETWSTRDKHGQAYDKMIRSDRTKNMERLLKIDAKAKDAGCLACHSTMATMEHAEANFRLESGVGCEACHGRASQWIDPHWKAAWRKLTAEEKAALGMRDLHGPIDRANLCLSCHLGNIEQGKLVTHEMYAAGHPPLPGFELATFVEAMPEHWKQPGVERESMPQTKAVLIGSLVALRQAANLLGEQARQKADMWPELALYDCQSCHHELRSKSWRQERRTGAQPGRPALPAWPLTLAEVAIAKLNANQTNVNELLRPLSNALDEQAFGKQTAVAQGAAATLLAIDAAVSSLQKQALTPADARTVLASICERATEAPVDYNTARQLAWACRIICNELQAGGNTDQFAGNEFEIDKVLKELATQLSLDLASGRQARDAQLDGQPLAVANRYDPEAFRQQMSRLKALLIGSEERKSTPTGEN